jgi:hypothetical protein
VFVALDRRVCRFFRGRGCSQWQRYRRRGCCHGRMIPYQRKIPWGEPSLKEAVKLQGVSSTCRSMMLHQMGHEVRTELITPTVARIALVSCEGVVFAAPAVAAWLTGRTPATDNVIVIEWKPPARIILVALTRAYRILISSRADHTSGDSVHAAPTQSRGLE